MAILVCSITEMPAEELNEANCHARLSICYTYTQTDCSLCLNVQDLSAAEASVCRWQRHSQSLMPSMSSRSVDRRPRELIVTDFCAADTDALVQHFKVLAASVCIVLMCDKSVIP